MRFLGVSEMPLYRCSESALPDDDEEDEDDTDDTEDARDDRDDDDERLPELEL